MGINKRPSLEDYWSCDPLLRTPGISRVMTIMRFQQILRFFHLNDNEAADAEDRLAKVRPLFSAVQQSCAENYNLHQPIAIDEQMIPFKGRHVSKQYNPLKPTRFGFKVWALSDSVSGYTRVFSVYLGKHGQESGKVADVVLRLCFDKLDHVGHTLYLDNYFSTACLFKALDARGIGACGTIRPKRLGKECSVVLSPKGIRAECQAQILNHSSVLAVSWRDKKL